MNFRILTIAEFDKQLKRLCKKYPSLKSEIAELAIILQSEPNKGTPIGRDCYKIRLSISSKGRGKSGGARVISYLTIRDGSVVLLSIYDKSEQSNINSNDLQRLIELAQTIIKN